MTCPLADLMNMKLWNHQFSTQPPTSDIYKVWKHPWYEYNENKVMGMNGIKKIFIESPEILTQLQNELAS